MTRALAVDATIRRDPDRVVWVIHQPTIDRRSGQPIDLNDVAHLGRPRVVLPPVETANNYVSAARAMWSAFDEFEDGDVVCSMGGDLHSLTMLDDMLRQRGVSWYVWAKYIGYKKYVEFVKNLTATDFLRSIQPLDAPEHSPTPEGAHVG